MDADDDLYDNRPPYQWQQDGIREILTRQTKLIKAVEGCLKVLIVVACGIGVLAYKALWP